MWLALGTKEWNTVLINQIIHPFDADEICKLRIPSNQAKDCVAWHYEKIGVFIVKSAYKLADAIKIQQTKLVSSSTRVVGDRNIWDLIWKSSVPEKIKKIGWRVATKHNTFRRTIVKEDMCKICGNGREDEHHAIISCTRRKDLRDAMRVT